MLIDDIRILLAAPRPAATDAFLARVDTTLTDGYAHALQLEAGRARIERRIAEIVASRPSGPGPLDSEELAGLAERVTFANQRIASLRALLGALRERRAEIRTAA